MVVSCAKEVKAKPSNADIKISNGLNHANNFTLILLFLISCLINLMTGLYLFIRPLDNAKLRNCMAGLQTFYRRYVLEFSFKY